MKTDGKKGGMKDYCTNSYGEPNIETFYQIALLFKDLGEFLPCTEFRYSFKSF